MPTFVASQGLNKPSCASARIESDEWNVATARSLEEEKKLLEAGFEYVRYSDRNEVAIYRKRK